MTFDSYHWQEAQIDDAELARARSRLASDEGEGTDFLALLRSDCAVAVGVALDHYHHAETMTRFGDNNPFDPYSDEILARARSVLKSPATLKRETGAYEDGANHSSALLVMTILADPDAPEDREAIASALQTASTRASLEAATEAAGMILSDASSLDQNLLNALAEIILDETRDVWDRVRGIVALGNVTDRRAGDVLARAAQQKIQKIQLEAAIILSSRHMSTHRGVIEEITSSWPEDADYPESLVLDALRAANVDGP
ncbi:hypothetical protein HRW14_03890 [Streptomyces lunaelactis]|uniref:hypothetical protein n=1 Tax=Streptomyces lunaelactis TaxID=1535768 RepID=UPI0015855E03|nr:hypothetical protein [Streptomyces lunaelactis]NUK22176.1 hypothetical protein [Streptomyces lunaelactis]NUK49445.1 hypothetical protein [Streptomyces lunaelactis]NUK63873.1 hypothetical protein [Streptomyces lunaelactis]